MVFINKTEELVKTFQNYSRKEIGIALLAYEEFLCKGLKVSNTDLKRLENVFEFYDEKYSNDYPSLTNEVLQNSNTLICKYFSSLVKDNQYGADINLLRQSNDSSCFDITIFDKHTGIPETYLPFEISHGNKRYDIDSFNTTYEVCNDLKEQVDENIKLIKNSLKI